MKILETHIVPALEENIRLQEYAPSVLKTISTRSGVKKAIKRQEILVDGKVASTSDWIKKNQKIELLQSETRSKRIFQLKMEVVYEDEYLAVVNKPAGYPTSGNYFKTIENALPFNLQPSIEPDALPYPLPVHRLDNPTSGLLIIAKTRKAQTILHHSFEDKKINKTYLALVHGTTPQSAIFTDKIELKSAVTNISTVKNIKYNGEDLSLVKVNPETGRTHQIRIHLSKNGFPIVGDKEYGEERTTSLKGLFLAAIELIFDHPVTADEICLTTSLPKKFNIF